MTRASLLLLLALMASCLLLIKTSYEGRRHFAALDRARNDAQELEAELRRLDAERRAQATHLRVEQVAREKLQMRGATAAVTAYVFDAGAAPDGAASAAAGSAR